MDLFLLIKPIQKIRNACSEGEVGYIAVGQRASGLNWILSESSKNSNGIRKVLLSDIFQLNVVVQDICVHDCLNTC